MLQANNGYEHQCSSLLDMKLLPSRSILSFIRNCENPYKIFVVSYNSPSSVWEFLLPHSVTNNRQFVSFSVVWMWKNISQLFAWLIVKLTASYVFIFQVTFFLRETLSHALLILSCVIFSDWFKEILSAFGYLPFLSDKQYK